MYYRLSVVKPDTPFGWIHTPTSRADDSWRELAIQIQSQQSNNLN
jgi:hypothetical protein